VIPVRIPFLSLAAADDGADVRAAIDRVIARGSFVLGPEVEAFEQEFAEASGAAYAVAVGSGTDAIALSLRALHIGPGDEVITTALSAAYTALAIVMAGATPVFADIDPERLTIDPDEIARLIGPRTRAIVPVHLYGQPADMEAIERIASAGRLAIVEDCCQAHLATSAGRPVGTIGAAGAFSFYPTKNLAALGDGGAVVTNDGDLARRIARLRNGGQTDRYHHQELGVNSRLDEMQAAILRTRLPRLASRTAARRALAARYRRALAGCHVHVPPECDPGHVYHLFPVLTGDRARLQSHLAARGIETLIHYPVTIPQQPAFAPRAAGAPMKLPIAERVCGEVLSLPLHPALAEDDLAAVAAAVKGHDECVR
jgi:dTDP-3-amino-3,4,6-trideoxy-alpha-D-glucose transaminase